VRAQSREQKNIVNTLSKECKRQNNGRFGSQTKYFEFIPRTPSHISPKGLHFSPQE
jgi:hypothetical protein